jgi:Zn-dependent peptidase ImmA (M78 family)
MILSAKTAADIDARVERVLRGLGNPEPPLRLEEVRHLLKLDRQFYTASDTGAVREKISRIRVGTIQVLARPTLLLEAIKKMSLKALYLPDRKRILLDGDLPVLKHRWNEAHEIGHSLLPWHEDAMHGDNSQTLSVHCHEQIEAEANYAAGRILFLRDRFTDEARSLKPAIASIITLRDTFGNTLSTTLYRFVEMAGADMPMVGMMSGHPHKSRRKADFDPNAPCRHFIQSPAFAKHFSGIGEKSLFHAVAGYCGSQRGGPLGECELILTDDNGDDHRFYFETFFNKYDALTLGVYLRPELRIIAA